MGDKVGDLTSLLWHSQAKTQHALSVFVASSFVFRLACAVQFFSLTSRRVLCASRKAVRSSSSGSASAVPKLLGMRLDLVVCLSSIWFSASVISLPVLSASTKV